MNPPLLVAPPDEVPVTLAQIKARLYVEHDEDDGLLEALIEQAVALLDGWHGALCRAIMPQTWSVEVRGKGPHRLPMPDVTEVRVLVDDTELPAGEFTVQRRGDGSHVTIDDHPGDAVIEFDCSIPETRRPVAQAAIALLVGHWFRNREAVVTGTITAEVPLSATALIRSLRWDG